MTIIIALLVFPFALLTLSFAVEVVVGLRPLEQVMYQADGNVTASIIVPAHNEALILETGLKQLKDATGESAQILLVADNCTDSTADIARKLEIETIERFDTDQRGKGFALDFAKDYLKSDPPDVIVVVDADCRIDSQSLDILIKVCWANGRPCQATNLQIPSIDSSPSVQLSTFAFYIKNVVRQRALQRLAGRANLLGTGMAFPWPIFAESDLATGNIVEDLKLGQELSERGHAPLFVEQAAVLSNAESGRDTLSQRSRWEGGFLQNALRVGPAMLGRSVLKRDIRGVWAALNAMIPPFALLILLDIVVAVFAGTVACSASASLWPVLFLVGSLLVSLAALGLAFRGGGSRFVQTGALLRAPIYILWKLPMYLTFARGNTPKEWSRTRRD